MKKIILILAGAFVFSAAAVQAQDVTQDTTRQSQQPKSEQSQNYLKDMTKIQATEIPASLRTTLQDTQYKGWENATIYRSKGNDMYMVEMKDASGKTKTHRFDANGKVVKDN